MKVVKKSRNSNIEILRIIAILMIIFSHYSVHCASEYLTTFSFNKIFCETLELGNLGVIIFILIFGYYYDTNKLRLNKFLNLVIPVIFYSVVLYLCFNKLDYHIIPCFFPVLFRRYWYVTAYIVLYLFSPYLSKFIESLTRSNFKKFLITIFLVWQIIPWAFSFIGQTAMYSSAFTDILPIYFLGAYLKKYPNNIFNKYKKYLKYDMNPIWETLIKK